MKKPFMILEISIVFLLLLSLVDAIDAMRTIESDLSTGSELDGKYRLMTRLYTGPQSQVFRAAMINDESKLFVVKFILDIPKNKGYINNEVDALKSLNHPNICKLVDSMRIIQPVEDGKPVEDENHYVALVMPHYDIDLKGLQKVHNGLFKEQQIKGFFEQMYEALNYMHSEGWAHRDLKLENILCNMDRDGYKITLTDFGCAIHSKYAHDYCGTKAYSSPESLNNLNNQTLLAYDTRKNDVWGLAVVLLDMVTGSKGRIDGYQDNSNLVMRIAKKSTQSQHAIKKMVKDKLISKKVAVILLKVFVPESQRIGLDDFYISVMKTKRLRSY